jgi:hypothetical protein
MNKRIHVTGALGTSDDPFAWMDELNEAFDEHEFVNAFELNDAELGADEVWENPEMVIGPAKEHIRDDADGLLARWEDGTDIPGTDMEILYAFQYDVPVVIWYDGYRDDLPLWLHHHSTGSWEDKEQCAKLLLALAGDTGYIE